MTILRFPRQSEFVAALALLVAGTAGLAQEAAKTDDQQMRVQITEIGCLRTLIMIDGSINDLENRVAQQLTDKDFRVFPSAAMVGARVTSDQMRDAGEKASADLVVFATATDRLKNKKEDFQLYEGEATVQIYSRVSGELLVTKTVRANGRRTGGRWRGRRASW